MRPWTRICSALVLVLSHPLWGATIVVDETTCTLVDAITAANTDGPVGGCAAGSGADIVELTSNVILTDVATPDCGPPCFGGDTGLPEVVSEIFLAGGGLTIERATDAPRFRLFLVSGTLSLEDVVLTNGDAYYYYYYNDAHSGVGGAIASTGTLSLTDTVITNSRPNGISNSGGTLTLTNSTVSNNGQVYGCQGSCTTYGLFPYGGGGGIYSSQGSVSLTNSQITYNRAGRGGGIAVVGGELNVTNSEISGNTAYQENVFGSAAGGGLMAQDATVSLVDSALKNNGVAFDPVCFGEFGCYSSGDALGGAIQIQGGSLTVINGTISGNSAVGTGLNWPGYPLPATFWNTGQGGSISNIFGSLELINTTVSGNVANDSGRAFVNSIGSITIRNSTVSSDDGDETVVAIANGGTMEIDQSTLFSTDIFSVTSGTTSVSGSIVAGGPTDGNCSGDGVVVDGGNNFSDDTSCGPGFAGITPGVDFDTALADNGGPTQTHALLPGSVAIDAAGDCGLATDQRGVPRDDGACDSGSYEFEPPSQVPVSSPWSLALIAAGLMAVLSVLVALRRRNVTPA